MSAFFNWTPDKEESPYSYGSEYPKFKHQNYTWRILAEGEKVDGLTEKDHVAEIGIFAELWDLHLIQEIRVSRLVRAVSFQMQGEKLSREFVEIREAFEETIDLESPIKVYTDYPFATTIEQTIFPVEMTTFWAKINTRNTYWLGYISWQIAKLYEDLYKQHEEEVGIGGHSLSDLQLAMIHLYKSNKMTLIINS